MSAKPPVSPHRQRGIAAITAILVVTLATMLAVDLLWELNLDVRQTQNLLVRDQAMQIALGAEFWVGEILKDDREQSDTVDHLGEDWARDIPPLPVEGGTVDGALEDMQGRFNLNNLVDRNGRRVDQQFELFVRLLEVLDLSPDIADAVADWLDADQLPDGIGGAEDDIYTLRDPPYRTANYFFQTAQELLAVDGIDADTFEILEPHITALPASADVTRINVNTASRVVLQALDPSITPADTEQWVADRLATPYENLDDFWSVTTPEVRQNLQNNLDVGTIFFQLKVIASLGTTQLSMYSLLERQANSVQTRRRTFDAY
jgi:general secretion pathway protein K